MKKRISLFILAATLLFVVAGCGKKSDKGNDASSKIKEDVIEFVNEELPGIDGKRQKAVDIYNSYFNDKNIKIDKFLTDLENTAVPEMTAYIDALNKIEISTDEVKELRDLYALGAQFQLDAMNKVIIAIKEENPDYLSEAKEMIKQSQTYFGEYQAALQLLAVDNDIKINGSFVNQGVASGSDGLK